MVGYPETPCAEHTSEFTVQSTWPIRTDEEASYSDPRSSHAGDIDLQCPHLHAAAAWSCPSPQPRESLSGHGTAQELLE
jgi:hypothetical protein